MLPAVPAPTLYPRIVLKHTYNICQKVSQNYSEMLLTPCLQAEPAREQMHEIGSTVTPGLPELPRAPIRSHADPVSSHILDTTAGRPAAGVAITMSRMGGVNQAWTKVASRLTNEDGRASAFLTWEQFTPGTYKMHFATGQYFR